MPPSHKGLHELFTYPLMSAIFDRRTRRVARGTSIVSGPISYTSPNKPAPLTPLEEAVLVVSTGLTGKVDDARRAGEERRRQRSILGAAHQRPRAIRQQHRQRARRLVLPDQRRGHVADQAPAQPGRAGPAEQTAAALGRLERRRLALRRGEREAPAVQGAARFPSSLAVLLHLEPPALEPAGHDDPAADRRSHPAVHQRRSSACCPRKTASGRCSSTTGSDSVHGALLDWGAWFASLVGIVPEHLVSDHRRRATRRAATGSTPSTRRRSGSPTRCAPTTRRSFSCRT